MSYMEKPPLDELMHYGVKRRSGRYPWGSGENPYQHSGDLLARVEQLQSEGLSEKDIAKSIGLSTTDLRMQVRVAKHERRALEAARAKALREDGLSLNEIAREMGYANDSSIRSLLNENTAAAKNRAKETAEILKKELDEKGVLDVGAGVERELNVYQQTLKEALFILETEGYIHTGIGLSQVTNKKQQTTVEIIAKPQDGEDVKDIQSKLYKDPELIKSVGNYYSVDGGKSWDKIEYPSSISSDRVSIRYGDEGGRERDGVIEIRPGVADLNLGNSHYAQVRIMVDGTHYLKGMAMYSDDIPDGFDIVFNTNKKTGTPKEKVMKEIKDDPDNPFGAALKANGQSWYDDPNGTHIDPLTGKKQSLSGISKVTEEGDWETKGRNLASQCLAKQPIKRSKQQLDLTYKDSADQFEEIMSIENPTIKKKMLLDFADSCEGAATHLKAAALPRQSTKVILPVPDLKDTEVYAPGYKNGEKVVLIRYPHGGTFEIPELTVNNKNKSAISILGKDISDAIGINPRTAEVLSGADFDGDQVIVIPTGGRVKIKTTKRTGAFKELDDFDPKVQYSTEGKKNVKIMSEDLKQKEMGIVSNLITDMTLKGAPPEDIVKAVKHSMVVIDAPKHKLDYKQSEIDNDIATLKQRWQGYTDESGKQKGGASTLLSRRKQTVDVPERRGSGMINPDTGEVTYKTSGRTYVDKKTGEVKEATTKVNIILNAPDVRTLSSGTPQENAYADYANKMKAMANEARKAYKATGNLEKSSSAAKTYANEVSSLNSKLNEAAKNAPRERRAQAIANSVVKAKVQSNPDMTKDEIKKASQIAINNARNSVGARSKDVKIDITDKEWEAIQAGAISDSKLTQILRYADVDKLRERATPRSTTQLSPARVSKANAMQQSGFTIAEIAESLGVSTSTVSKYLKS